MTRHIMKVPDVGEGVVEIEVVEWMVKSGDTIEEDQHIVDVMTDKATVEITSPVAGKVLTVHGVPGDMLAVGSEMIVFEVEGGAAEDSKADATPTARTTAPPETQEPAVSQKLTKAAAVAEPKVVKESAKPEAAENAVTEKPGKAASPGQVLASPAVRRRAREANIDLSLISGTGSGNRVTIEDLDQFLEAGAGRSGTRTAARRSGTTEIKVIGLRRLIAEKMATSKRHIPHFSYVEEIDVTELESLRKHLNEGRKPDQPKLTYLPFIVQSMTRLLVDHPECNAHFDDDAGIITRFDPVHMGIATQTSKGLMVPVVQHAETLDVWQIARQITEVSEAARNNTLGMDKLSGSTITITSLGALGGVVSTPVINYPEVAIIGVNKSIERPVILGGQVTARLMMNLSSSFDHRVVDGYDAARFIQALKGMLEHPATMFM